MNNFLTWANYARIISICLVFYYFIVLSFFRAKATRASSKASTSLDEKPIIQGVDTTRSNNLDLFGEETNANIIRSKINDFQKPSLCRMFADEVEAFTLAEGDSITRNELIDGLQVIIQKYPSLAGTESKYELSQLIAISTENNCSIHVSADELRELWKV